jgi:hypothetical protein
MTAAAKISPNIGIFGSTIAGTTKAALAMELITSRDARKGTSSICRVAKTVMITSMPSAARTAAAAPTGP